MTRQQRTTPAPSPDPLDRRLIKVSAAFFLGSCLIAAVLVLGAMSLPSAQRHPLRQAAAIETPQEAAAGRAQTGHRSAAGDIVHTH